MSQFYDQASLVMVPSGYKAGKVYSQKPLTTDGQLTFTRTGDTATRVVLSASGQQLVEKVRTNLILYSQDFSTANWLIGSVSKTTGQTDPNGGTTAVLVTSTNTSGAYMYQTSTGAGCMSIYAKAGTRSTFSIIPTGFGNGAYFNLSNATATSIGVGSLAKIESVGGGWFRCSVYVSSNVNFLMALSDTSGGGMNIGDSVYFAFAQFEAGDIATAYIPTTSAAVSVGPVANLPRIDYTGGGCGKLLLEPQRTQLFYDSTPRNFTTSVIANRWIVGTNNPAVVNQAVGIFGYNSATKYTKTAGQTIADFLYYSQAPVVSGSVYTVSGYVKLGTASNAVFVLNNAGAWNTVTGGTFVANAAGGYNEWKRFSITFTAPASNKVNLHIGFHQQSGLEAQATGTFFVEGLQLELGSYETSLIPSDGAAVTRGADAAYKTGLTSSIIGQTEGTVFVEFKRVPKGVNYQAVVTLQGASSAYLIEMYFGTSNTLIAAVYNSGAQYLTASSALTEGTYKAALAYKENDFAFYLNGVQISTDNSGTVPALSTFNLGDFSYAAGYPQSDGINQALLFPTRLTNAQLAELTAL